MAASLASREPWVLFELLAARSPSLQFALDRHRERDQPAAFDFSSLAVGENDQDR
jgi:hypothetical protein